MKKTVSQLFIVSILTTILSCSSQQMGLSSSVDAAALANDYASNLSNGNKKYKGKYLTVVGTVSQYYKNKYQQNIIILMDKKRINGVKCVLNNSSKQIKRPIRQGEFIKINGRCNGFDEYVLLSGCIILKD